MTEPRPARIQGSLPYPLRSVRRRLPRCGSGHITSGKLHDFTRRRGFTGPHGFTRPRGFTLTELMIVVVIMGVLATLGTVAFRQKMSRAKTTQALSGLRAIGAAQEAHRAESGVYLNVSANLSTYYPPLSSGKVTTFFGHSGDALWVRLDPKLPELTSYAYATTAGLPFSSPGAPDANVVGVTWPTASTIVEPWYVVAARGDADSDGTYSYFLATSLTSRIHIQNGDE